MFPGRVFDQSGEATPTDEWLVVSTCCSSETEIEECWRPIFVVLQFLQTMSVV
jgi:hypothetical protein